MAALLPALALAQAAGIVAADRLAVAYAPAWLASGMLLVLAGVLGRPRLRAGLLLLAVASIGAASLAGPLEGARAASLPDPEVTVEATLASVSWQEGRVRIDAVEAVSVSPGPPVPRRLRLHGRFDARFPAALQEPLAGERWRLRVRLREPGGARNPGGRDRARSLARRGIAQEGSLVHPGLAVRVGDAGGGPARSLRRWRRRTAERVIATGAGGPLLAALGLGERRGLAPGIRESFARLGLAHLLAVSGLHLAMAASAAYLLARKLLARWVRFAARRDARRAALCAAVLAALLYALASGFGIPVQRALVLLCAAGLALASRRARRRGHPLALASLLVLAREPHALFEPGFQLSFCATAGLLLAGADPAPAAAEARFAERAARFTARLLRTSALALLATTPLVAIHFSRLEPAGLVANLLAIPLTGFVLLPAAGLAALAAGFDGVLATAALAFCERLAAIALAAVEAAAGGVRVGLAVAPPPAWALLVAGALALAALRRGRARDLAVALLLQSTVLALAPPRAITPPPPRVVVLDVGQGDATLVQGRSGVLLVDAGPLSPTGFDAGRETVVPALRALGVRRIDRLALSHADLDHRGGAPAVIESLPVGAIWLPHHGAADARFGAVRGAARARGIPVLERDAGAPAERVGDLAIEFLGPPRADPGPVRNDASLILRVRAGEGAVLLAGDVGAEAERALLAGGTALGADVLLLPHHGSRTSSTAELLSAVAPAHAIASAPCVGRFDMPHPSVRDRLALRGTAVHWTGRDGAILVGLAPRILVRPWGPRRRGCGVTARPGTPVVLPESR